MKPLSLLLSVFLIGLLLRQLTKRRDIHMALIGRIAMAGMFLFTGVAHFVFTEGMTAMIPSWIPYKVAIVNVSGVFEIIGALGLLSNKYAKKVAIALIFFLVLALPLNIYSSINYIDPLTASPDGPGPVYLLFRIPLQLFFILWIYLSAIKPAVITFKKMRNGK